MKSMYQYKVKTISGVETSLEQYQGQVLLIVNVASQCGFTPQYKGLQELHSKLHAQGFSVLAFPCNQFKQQEPASEPEIQQFCETNYHIEFPLFAKINVNGANADPLFQYLKQQAPGIAGTKGIKWNFTKFLINRDGQVIRRFSPLTKPEQIEDYIEAVL